VVNHGHEHAVDDAAGFTCPTCGGALWRSDEHGELHFACRIGDAFSAAELWIEHGALRNRTLNRAVRVLAENAALAHALGDWARQHGNSVAAARISEEARDDEHVREAIAGLLEGLSSSRSSIDGVPDV
jgi:two-component system, chemotaxis family, protein-glutamate methylesterase/glutaminase